MRSVPVLLLLAVCGCFSDPSGSNPGDGTDSSTDSSTGETSPGTSSSGHDEASTSDDGNDESTSDDPSDSSTTSVESAACGDRVVGPDEMCDSSPGCEDDCTLTDYNCNPLNQVGCIDAQTCDRSRGATLDDQRTACFMGGKANRHEFCTYNPLDPALQCADGLSCVGSAFVPGCEGLAECCTEFCVLGGEPCIDPTAQCLTWKEPGMPPGLDEVGLCFRLP